MGYPTPLPAGVTDQDEIKTDGGVNLPGRTARTKVWQRSPGVFVFRAQGDVHYKDWLNQDGTGVRFREIDTTLTPVAGGWSFAGKYAPYYPVIPARSNEYVTYLNFAHDRGPNIADYDQIGIKVAGDVPGQLEASHRDYTNASVLYPDALGPDIHLRTLCNTDALRHETEIAVAQTGVPSTGLELEYELDIPAGYDVRIGTVDWDKNGTTRTTEVIRIGKTGTPRSEWIRMRRARAWDAGGRQIPISVDFSESGGRLFMTKIIPRSFLLSATYPVYTDAVLSPGTGIGDGTVEYNSNVVWDTVHNATTGTIARTARLRPSAGSAYRIERAFIPFDCSALPSSPTITAIDLNLYKIGDQNTADFGVGAATLTSNTSNPVTGDYDGCTVHSMTEFATRWDKTDHTLNAYTAVSFNASGIAEAVDGWNVYVLRIDSDIDDAAEAGGLTYIEYADYDDTPSTSPTLDITYSTGYSLTCDGGTYTETGTAASLEYGRAIDAAAGSYTETGTAANLEYGRIFDAAGGTYAATGTAANLEYGRAVDAAATTYTLTGSDATLTYEQSFTLNAEAGSYAATGTAASLELGSAVDAGAGAYVLTGTDATLTKTGNYEITADAGTYALSGTDATLTAARTIAIEAGSYTETGSAVALEYGRALDVEAGAYVLTGSSAALVLFGNVEIPADPGSFTVSGAAAGLLVGHVADAEATSYSVTGQDVAFDLEQAVAAYSGTYTVAGTTAVLDYESSEVGAPRDVEVGYHWRLRGGMWVRVFGVIPRYTSSFGKTRWR